MTAEPTKTRIASSAPGAFQRTVYLPGRPKPHTDHPKEKLRRGLPWRLDCETVILPWCPGFTERKIAVSFCAHWKEGETLPKATSKWGLRLDGNCSRCILFLIFLGFMN